VVTPECEAPSLKSVSAKWRLPRCQATRTKCNGSLAADFKKRLRRRDHLDQPAILEHQRIATAQGRRILEIEQEFETRGCPSSPSRPPMAVVEVENDGVRRRARSSGDASRP